ncbi:hypothetical protein J6590_085186 [Homalodisca vitripennis]|nr:hypothetical protein J6590_085186 [Homalodisca vitripennis]
MHANLNFPEHVTTPQSQVATHLVLLPSVFVLDEHMNTNKSQSTDDSQDSGTIVKYCQCRVTQAMSICVCNISTSSIRHNGYSGRTIEQ